MIPFIVLILSYLALKETLHKLEILNMFASFAGVLLIVVVSSRNKEALQLGDLGQSPSHFILGVLANAFCATSFAVINVVVRSLKSVHHSLVASFQSTANFVLSLIGLVVYRLWFNPNGFVYNFSAYDITLLMLSGVVRSMGMVFFVLAFQLDKAGRSASLNFLQIIFGYLMDISFFGYAMEGYEIAGTLIIVTCSVLVFLIKIYKVQD